KTPKPEGWLEVEPIDFGYPKTVIATQVKGDALAPDFEHNTWILLNTKIDQENLTGQIALVHNEIIQDGYEGSLALRRLSILEKQTPGKLFGVRIVMLEALNRDCLPIEVNIDQRGEVEVVGVLFDQTQIAKK